ncbi:MAG TPA: hypothetical protein VFG69_13490, partial [Nannocystaceae bacterium]|nr:hypothetical protein [Nannocystaceae bacterium]
MTDDGELRRHVRESILTGRLPRRPADRVWGGAGSDCTCSVCGRRVGAEELEFELEFDRSEPAGPPQRLHAHAGCLRAWEREVASLASVGPSLPASCRPDTLLVGD